MCGKSASHSTQGVFYQQQHYHLSYYIFCSFSDFTLRILFYSIFPISSCHPPRRRDSLKSFVIARSVKASGSPKLPSQPKPGGGLFPATYRTPVRPKPKHKNTIPVILSGVNEEFRNWRQLMGESRQFHSRLKTSQIKELSKGDFLIIGDSEQDTVILQSESKMKAGIDKNVKVSLPKAFQTKKPQT